MKQELKINLMSGDMPNQAGWNDLHFHGTGALQPPIQYYTGGMRSDEPGQGDIIELAVGSYDTQSARFGVFGRVDTSDHKYDNQRLNLSAKFFSGSSFGEMGSFILLDRTSATGFDAFSKASPSLQKLITGISLDNIDWVIQSASTDAEPTVYSGDIVIHLDTGSADFSPSSSAAIFHPLRTLHAGKLDLRLTSISEYDSIVQNVKSRAAIVFTYAYGPPSIYIVLDQTPPGTDHSVIKGDNVVGILSDASQERPSLKVGWLPISREKLLSLLDANMIDGTSAYLAIMRGIATGAVKVRAFVKRATDGANRLILSSDGNVTIIGYEGLEVPLGDESPLKYNVYEPQTFSKLKFDDSSDPTDITSDDEFSFVVGDRGTIKPVVLRPDSDGRAATSIPGLFLGGRLAIEPDDTFKVIPVSIAMDDKFVYVRTTSGLARLGLAPSTRSREKLDVATIAVTLIGSLFNDAVLQYKVVKPVETKPTPPVHDPSEDNSDASNGGIDDEERLFAKLIDQMKHSDDDIKRILETIVAALNQKHDVISEASQERLVTAVEGLFDLAQRKGSGSEDLAPILDAIRQVNGNIVWANGQLPGYFDRLTEVINQVSARSLQAKPADPSTGDSVSSRSHAFVKSAIILSLGVLLGAGVGTYLGIETATRRIDETQNAEFSIRNSRPVLMHISKGKKGDGSDDRDQ